MRNAECSIIQRSALSLDMRRLLAAAVFCALASRGGLAQPPRVPVLVELYTSEGCSSCPPADALLESLLRDQPIAAAQVIPIGLHVDYFNDLGWKDAFSSAAYTARQRSYSTVFGDDNLYTPQMVIDGNAAVPGTETDRVRHAIAQASGKPHLPLHMTARQSGDKAQLTIDCPAAPLNGEKIQVIAAMTEDGLSSLVTRGENHGRTLHHVAVARLVQSLDALSSKPSVSTKQLSIDPRWGKDLKAVVWLQGTKSRQVYGAVAAELTR
jgi:hypothetical protein